MPAEDNKKEEADEKEAPAKVERKKVPAHEAAICDEAQAVTGDENRYNHAHLLVYANHEIEDKPGKEVYLPELDLYAYFK